MIDVFRVRHETVYRYKSPVAFGEHRMLLRPREGIDQRLLDYRLEISPSPATLAWAEDPAGNIVARATFKKRARELKVVATMRIERTCVPEDYRKLAAHAERLPFSYGVEDGRDLAAYIERQQHDPQHAVDRWAREILEVEPTTLGFLKRLNAAIRRTFAYRRREEAGIMSAAATLASRSGSCRDFAVLMIEAVRSLGIAARFVSGYLHVREADGRTYLAGGSTHAWMQVYLPGLGWLDFDPTSGTVGNRDLLRVAVVRDPSAASPLSGTYMGFPNDYEGMAVRVDVTPDAIEGGCVAAAG